LLINIVYIIIIKNIEEKNENEIYICCLLPNSLIILKHDENVFNKFLFIKVNIFYFKYINKLK